MFSLSKIQQIYLIIASILFTFLIIQYLNEWSSTTKELKLIPANELALNDALLSTSSDRKLINITLKYLLNSEHLCQAGEDILAVFIITSYFGNVETRSSIRRAFNVAELKRRRLRRVFLLGEAPNDKFISQQSVNDESSRFGDIVQGNFSEAYRNLTYKHVMGLKWAARFCPKAQYVIKMDDDTVVNMYSLKIILDSLGTLGDRDFIAGYKLSKMKPIREPANKWYVTREEYSSSNYPMFVSGWFYVAKPKTAMKLAVLANYEKYFWIDDVFVTGILANKLKILLYDLSKYFVVNSEFLQCCLQDFDKNINCDVYIGPNGGDNDMFYKFNEKVRKCEKCLKLVRPLNETCVAERRVNLGRGDPVIKDFKLF